MNKKLLILTIIINLVLLGGQYYLSSMRATDGEILADLDQQLNKLTLENQQYHNNISTALSLERIQEFAIRQHLAPVASTFIGPNPVAAVLISP